MPYVAKAAGIGGALMALILAVVLTINTALVALVWNGLDLHGAVGAGTLSLVQCIGVGIVLLFVGV